jgi:uncharacterized UPF0160 family protein
MSRISDIIAAAPRYTPTREHISELRAERARLVLRQYRLTWSKADEWRVRQVQDQIRSLEVRILEDELALGDAA